MTPIELAAKFVAEECDFCDPLEPDEDIFKRAGITGDDAVDFFDSFAARFEVDMSGFLWYFHHEEEGSNLGGGFFGSPDRQVHRIPITLRVLADAITHKSWSVDYPEHEAPIARPDLFINRILLLGILGGLLWALLLLQRTCGLYHAPQMAATAQVQSADLWLFLSGSKKDHLP